MSTPPFRILVVCTANICRSVIAERLLRRGIEQRGLPVEVSSCGLLFDGSPASDMVVSVLAEEELDVTDHRSRRFTPSLLDQVDLVVTMERMHVRELAAAIDGSPTRIHTLVSLVDWLSGSGAVAAGAGPADAVAACAEAREPSDLFGRGRDEVADPHGRSRRVHRRTVEQLEELCGVLLDGLFAAPGDPAQD